MTERLYYHDSFLYEFEGEVAEVVPAADINARTAVYARPHRFLSHQRRPGP